MTASCYAVRYGMAEILDTASKKGAALTVLFAMGVAAIVYLAILRLFKAEETEFIWNMLCRRFRRQNGNGNVVDTSNMSVD